MNDAQGIGYEEMMKLEPVSEAYCAAHKVHVGKKSLRFQDKYGQVSISFSRGVAHTGSPDFNIRVQEEVPVTARCSLGHNHQTGKTETKWGCIQLSWDQATTLMDWFQSGNWKQVREASKIEKQELDTLKKQVRSRTMK